MPILMILIATIAAARPDATIADFEASTYAGWTTAGSAFGDGPASGALPGQMAVGNYTGDRLVNSFHGGDDSVGTLTSPEFAIDRKFLRFLVGGGRYPGETCVNLVVDGKVVRTAAGHDSEFLRAEAWDVSDLVGKAAKIEVVDSRKGGWGHVLADEFVLSDTIPKLPDERGDLLARAERAVREAAPRAEADPSRPTYHVLPPANWVNDPNGPIYYKGYYHLFYQQNPYGDDWGNMHWGHVRSKDLAHWERMPIALWPSKRDGEEHVFSGCATVNPLGELMIFYTSIGPRDPEQWAAVPDSDDLSLWKKHPANPIMTETLHGKTKVSEWRDPFVFRSEGRTFMVLGGNLNENKGGQGVVNVYRADDPELTKWSYLGVLFTHPDPGVKNVECPLFFPLGNKWVLITSQGRPVHWFVGSLDPKMLKFTPERRGLLDLGSVYAPNAATAKDGRTLLWGWVQDVPKGKGWNGCLTLPRVLSLTKDGDLASSPASELSTLRGASSGPARDLVVSPGSSPTIASGGDSIELRVTLDLGTSTSCGLRIGDSTTIAFDGKSLDVSGVRSPVPPGAKSLALRVFVDRSILEVYPPSGVPITRVIPPDSTVSAFSVGGDAAMRGVESWTMGSIWKAD